MCEVEVDGTLTPVWGKHPALYENRPHGQPDFGLIRRIHVQVGSEVGPLGNLFEFEGTTRMGGGGQITDLPLSSLARIPLDKRARYPRIFINYRREDSDAFAGRLHELLSGEFGEDEVFLAEFSIWPGEPWHWTIQQAVVHAEAMLTLVGRRWLDTTDGSHRRIDQPNDIVRREIVAAMDRGTTILPILLPEAAIPLAADFRLDDDLALLPEFQFHRFGGARHWKQDAQDLMTVLRRYLPPAAPDALGPAANAG